MGFDENAIAIGQTWTMRLVDHLSRTQIVQYAGASGDYNPLHTDEIFATQVAGYGSVFAHGMLTMGLIGQILGDHFGPDQLKKFGARFQRQVWPGDTLDATVSICDFDEQTGEVELSISIINHDGLEVLSGYAQAIYEQIP